MSTMIIACKTHEGHDVDDDGVIQGPKCDELEGNLTRAADRAIGKFIVKLNSRCVEARAEAASLREQLTASNKALESTRAALETEHGKYMQIDLAFGGLCKRYETLSLWFGWSLVTIAALVTIGGVAWLM